MSLTSLERTPCVEILQFLLIFENGFHLTHVQMFLEQTLLNFFWVDLITLFLKLDHFIAAYKFFLQLWNGLAYKKCVYVMETGHLSWPK